MTQNILSWLTFFWMSLLASSNPHFDPAALLQQVLVPADAAVGSIIYRLRASDPSFEYPLLFTLVGEPTTVSIDNLNCTRLNSICQANVVLRRRLEAARFYDFTVNVQNQRGANTILNCSIRATNATTPINEIFPGAPTLLMVSESARRNTELGTVIAKGNPHRTNGVLLELWGAPEFGLYQKFISSKDAQATIVLLRPLDYEKRTVHHLTILANDPWTNINEDTRNIASWPLLVAVLDEQDTPPVFTLAPPTTTLSPSLMPGDAILRIHAEDGDRGKPRDIRYGLVPEGNPFTTFFNISEDTGELRLGRPLSEIVAISHTGQPILLTVIAEEVRTDPKEPPAQSSTVSLALIPPGVKPGVPVFGAGDYKVLLEEDSPVGTVLELPQAEIVTPAGNVVTLELEGNNGTFDISPSAVEGQSKFEIKVRDPKLLDYELWHSVQCYILAKEIGSNNLTAKAKLEVLLTDINDNVPEFSLSDYKASVQEGATIGTTVLRVEAVDVDRQPGSKIKYTRLVGVDSESFGLDPTSGLITVSNSLRLDAEKTPSLSFFVEAADEDGKGQTSTATVTVNLIDVNDQIPQFDKSVYEFILKHDKNSFTTRAFIKATDQDITSPNNEVHYELINPVRNLYLNERTGELLVTQTWPESKVIVTVARAWDGGVPRLASECEIRIYPPDGQSRRMVFIVPGRDPDLEVLRKKLSTLTGARIVINEVKPYVGTEPGATDVSRASSDKSVVVVTATYSEDSVVDVNTVQQVLDDRRDMSKIQTAKSGGNLLWLLILLLVLLALLALALVLCCICQGCPLYIPPKRRKVVSAHIQKVIQGSGIGKESKSVQVAEWFGRREAWTPEHVLVDNEAESLQRHEQERGSDRIELRHTVPKLQREPSREQLYIREGNTDILRLITRGNEAQRPDQAYFITDSGKDILMRRFIDQQRAEVLHTHIPLPNAVRELQTEQELLETSLRQKNALLRQILSERERDLRLETQSLPAGTQTDQDAETQTEPLFLRPPQRKVRSDNDASDGSDDELAILRARAKRRRRTHLRKIKTPIQEESEIEVLEKPKTKSSKTIPSIKHTKTSELRQKASAASKSSRTSLRKEVLKEISASLDVSDDSEQDYAKYYRRKHYDYFSDDSLDEISPRSEKTTDSGSKKKYRSKSHQKYLSETDLRQPPPPQHKKSQSHTDLSVAKTDSKPLKTKPQLKKTSRYMEWYNKDGTAGKPSKQTDKTKEDEAVKEVAKKVSSRLLKPTESSVRKKVQPKKHNVGPEHPLLQHSAHRFEAQYVLARKPEEDADSGIVLTRLPIAEKKSVFTIAYDDMHTKQLRPDSHSPPL